jgi:hypothetical protein
MTAAEPSTTLAVEHLVGEADLAARDDADLAATGRAD